MEDIQVLDYLKRTITESGIQFNIDKLDCFQRHMSDLLKIKDQFRNKLPELRQNSVNTIVKYEYSKGGETLPRGYYCPSPVLDLIVGNCKRGRLYKRTPKFGQYSYEYGFDNDRRLIRVRGVTQFTTQDDHFNEEYLIYNGSNVLGIGFNNNKALNVVSICNYDNCGNIIRYIKCSCTISEYADLHYEVYRYEDDRLLEVIVFFNIVPLHKTYWEQRYLVGYDDVGNISTLTGGEFVNGVWSKQVYEVNVRVK